ncbi:MAG: M20/M25/M40 family metallo-hydrolase [Clostridia bacterium]|nr:M20/M25/M40 family metallo-hydrolase [Clostridia bacterium]
MKLKSELKKLSASVGVSGFEQELAKEIAALFAPYVDEVRIDALGSVIAHKRAEQPNAIKVMLDAHMDEIGLMVTEIDEKGFLKFTTVGGVDERILPSALVTVHGKQKLTGVIGVKPPHLQAPGEDKQSYTIKDLAIDIGLAPEAAKDMVRPGDFVSFAQKPHTLKNGFMSGKCMDNRAGVVAVLEAAKALSEEKIDADVYYVLSVQEEFSLGGAKTAAYGIGADVALVIDVTHAKTHDNKDGFDAGAGLSYSIGPNVSPIAEKWICKCAKKLDIPIFPEVDGGSTGTNAWSVQTVGTGVATAVISIPLKYMHTPTEVLNLEDVSRAGALAAAFVKKAAKSGREAQVIEL